MFSFLLGLLCLAIFPAEAATIHEQTGKDDGTGDQARFNSPHGIGFDAAGNLYVADLGHSSTRKITPGAVVTTFAAGSRRVGNDDGTGIEATFSEPNGLAVDTAGNIYVLDERNHTLRKITPDATTGTLAGELENSDGADGPGVDARFDFPGDVAVDAKGNVYVADSSNHDIRRVSAGD